MSFAKAKVQRFNDIKDCSPSPTKYNVADVRNKWIRGGFFTKSGRFTRKDTSPPPSDNESVKSTPCFLTPKPLPKKKKSLTRSFTKTSSSNNSSSSSKSNDKEQLQEKIVECRNKDVYIEELLEQLEELKIKCGNKDTSIKELLQQFEELELKYNQIEQERDRTSIENDLLNDEIKQLKLNCNQYLNDIEVKIIENHNINAELTQICSDYKELKQKNHDMEKLLENINKCETLYKQTIEDSKIMLEIKEIEYEENLKKIENQKREEIDNLQQIIDDKNTKITLLESRCREIDILQKKLEESRNLLNEKDAKILLLEENFRDVKFLAEIQTKEKLDELEQIWQIRFNDQQNQYDSLLKQYEDINKIEQLKSSQQNYQELSQKYENLKCNQDTKQQENDDLLKQIHKYEITTKTNLDTIDVLKKRLIASDRDVEQFKDELRSCESNFVNYENLIISLRRQLQDYQVERDELEMQYESTLKTTQDQIEAMKTTLLNKVDGYDRIVKEYLDRNDQQQRQFNEIYQQLSAQQYLNQQSQVLIERAKDLIENNEEEIDRLTSKNHDLITLINSYENKIVLYENEIDENQEIRRKYIEISGKYDEILQNYEQLQQQLKDLDIEKTALNEEYQQLNQKYVDIVSHQNNKQKIKHISHLKSDAGELFQHNVDLRKENNRLQKIIDKLNRDLSDLKKPIKKIRNGADKENVLSPNRLASRTDSPGPLREVN